MKASVLLFSASLALASCTNPDGTTNNTGTDSAIGGVGGAAAGGLLGNIFSHGSAGGTAIGALIGGVGGYFIGNAIGAKLDERDRELANESTNEALAEQVYVPPPGETSYVRHPRPHHWSSDHTTARGSTTVVKVSVNSQGSECRTLKQLAVINGQEVNQPVNYCQNADGAWKAVSA